MSTPMTKKLVLDHVTFAYPNGYVAVEDVSMEFEGGGKYAIIGQNGAGKSTTVKLMNGLLRPREGKVYVDGIDIAQKTCAQVSRRVGYVFQNPGDQIFNATVYKEIEYGLVNGEEHLGATEIKSRVIQAARICGVEEYLDQNPYDLPFSLRKFVTIAICIANDCDVVILDEPTAGQDVFGLKTLTQVIDWLIAQNKTVITITHDMDFVIDNFDQIVVMAHKNVIFQGSVNEVFWNHEILADAALRQPTIAELAARLGYTEHVVRVHEFCDCVLKH